MSILEPQNQSTESDLSGGESYRTQSLILSNFFQIILIHTNIWE